MSDFLYLTGSRLHGTFLCTSDVDVVVMSDRFFEEEHYTVEFEGYKFDVRTRPARSGFRKWNATVSVGFWDGVDLKMYDYEEVRRYCVLRKRRIPIECPSTWARENVGLLRRFAKSIGAEFGPKELQQC